jgi:hypothetical protein
VSNERYPTSFFRQKLCDMHYLQPQTQKSHRQMQGFARGFLKDCFYFRKLCPTANTGSSALRAPFLPRSQLLPGARGNMSHLFTLCRGVSFQKRSKPCCTTGRTLPSTLPWCGAQSLIQANHCLLRTTHAHPIHASRLCP